VTRETGLVQQVADLLRETGRAHHQAFMETDGDDPEWPLWYAGYLQDRLGRLLNRAFTKSEVVYFLVMADKEQSVRAPGADWATFYATLLLERYD
jgi:hypothetical protein